MATMRASVTDSPWPKQFHSVLVTTSLLLLVNIVGATNVDHPKPTPWPKQFHSVLVTNYSGSLQVIDLWYDWTNGRNFNIIQYQLGKLYYDLEWNNGTSFGYYLDSDRKCSSIQFEVGILRPNWLDGATYVGRRKVDGFDCYVWAKADFITYYEDVVTRRPVLWVFYTGREAHVMTFEVGAVLEDAKWQVPWYCFEETTPFTTTNGVDGVLTHRGLVDFGAHKFGVK